MEKEFERIVYAYSDSLFRIAMHYMKNTADAQDIVQQTFLKLVEKNINFDNAEHEKAWLIRVCINLCKDSLKSSWRKKVTPIERIFHPSDTYEISDSTPVLDHIRRLHVNHRTAIYLFYYEDLPVSEIARIMGAKQNTVLSWLRRGRQALEKMIKEEL